MMCRDRRASAAAGSVQHCFYFIFNFSTKMSFHVSLVKICNLNAVSLVLSEED